MGKLFTLDQYLGMDSKYKIAVEFEEDDCIIVTRLMRKKSPVYAWKGPFSGHISIKLFEKEIARPEKLTYPALHIKWLNKKLPDFLLDDKPEMSRIRSLDLLQDGVFRAYNRLHRHLFNYPLETLPIIYRSKNGFLRVEGLDNENRYFAYELEKGEFELYIQSARKEFIKKIREKFPRVTG